MNSEVLTFALAQINGLLENDPTNQELIRKKEEYNRLVEVVRETELIERLTGHKPNMMNELNYEQIDLLLTHTNRKLENDPTNQELTRKKEEYEINRKLKAINITLENDPTNQELLNKKEKYENELLDFNLKAINNILFNYRPSRTIQNLRELFIKKEEYERKLHSKQTKMTNQHHEYLLRALGSTNQLLKNYPLDTHYSQIDFYQLNSFRKQTDNICDLEKIYVENPPYSNLRQSVKETYEEQLNTWLFENETTTEMKWEGCPVSFYLNSVDLRFKKITKMNWKGCPASLTCIYLGNNQITEINWEGCPAGLKYIFLDENQITEMKWKGCPAGLKQINLRDNQITETNWRGCPASLEEIDLEGNRNDITEMHWYGCPPVCMEDLAANLDELKEYTINYTSATKIQKAYKKHYQKRIRAVLKIEEKCHDWVWKPICKDGSIGIRPRLDMKALSLI